MRVRTPPGPDSPRARPDWVSINAVTSPILVSARAPRFARNGIWSLQGWSTAEWSVFVGPLVVTAHFVPDRLQWDLVGHRDEPLELACRGVSRDLLNNAYVDLRIREPVPLQ
jgi:hypothetical protein